MKPLWIPSPDRAAKTHISAFTRLLADTYRHGVPFQNYSDLHHFSVKSKDNFWREVFSYSEILHEGNRTPTTEGPAGIRDTQWFPNVRLNYAENLLRHSSKKPALISVLENGESQIISFAELLEQVSSVAEFLRTQGVQAGDRVVAVMPNCAATTIAMLGTTSIGAIWSSCSPDFGSPAIIERFAQLSPKVLFLSSDYSYAGKSYNLNEKNKAIVTALHSVRVTVLCTPPHSSTTSHTRSNISSVSWNEVISTKVGKMFFPQFPFEHPLFILFSSGTTGIPKGIVHGAGGTLLQHAKEHILHTDIHAEDIVFYYTTCGWMMWNWLMSSLARGSTIVLYDGSPLYPGPAALWDLIDRFKISVFGTSAKYLTSIQKTGLCPKKSHFLQSLKTILSTGSPLLPESFEYVYQSVASDVCLSSISGGTDIVSCFALGNPTLPVYRGEIQCLGLGMDVQIFDYNGAAKESGAGELVCCSPFPSRPVSFWNDKDGGKYQSAYFEKFPGVWHHGDWAERTDHNGLIIFGRSDATLNPGGIRIGTAEIYQAIEPLPEIDEAMAVGQEWKGDVRIILFVKLSAQSKMSAALFQKICDRIRTSCSPHHVPKKIISIPDIPRTMNGKFVELAVRDTIHGKEIKNREALANPEALEYFKNLSELEKD